MEVSKNFIQALFVENFPSSFGPNFQIGGNFLEAKY